MTKIEKVAIATAIALAATGSLLAGGFKGGDMPGKGGNFGGHGMFPCASELALSDTQKATIQQLESEFRTNMDSIKDSSTNPMKAAVSNGSFDKSAFIDAMNANHTQMVQLMADYTELKYNVLSDEQKATFVKLMTENNSTACRKRGF